MCSLSERSKDAPVNIHDVSIHKVGSFGGQENYSALEIFRVTPAGGRCAADDELVEWMSIYPDWSCLRSCKITRANPIYLDVMFRPFRGHVLCKHFQATFRCRICANGFPSHFAHHRANVNDLAASPFNHFLSNIFRHNEGTGEIDLQYLLPITQLHIDHGRTLYNT